MRAVQIERFGGPEVLTVRELPEPVPGPGQVLVRTVAAGINPVDWKTRIGMGGEPAGGFPATLGWDLAGVVVSEGRLGFAVGDRVVAMTAQIATGIGAWSDLVALPEEWLAPAPRQATLAEAATLPLAGLTARQALDRLALKPGERLLVTGAAGAVGAVAVQLARLAGVVPHALVSRPSHRHAALALGAELVIHDPADVPKDTYDAVFDTAGAPVGQGLVADGRFVTVSDDPIPELPHRSSAGRHYVQHDDLALRRLVGLVDDGKLSLRVAATHPVREVRAASEYFEAGGLLGKVVLTF